MTILSEGLKEGDLADLVQTTISVDEYESKIDDNAVVVAFYVKDNDPAQDLNRFIQKSSVNLLDTDVSPAPNEDGFFLVFVEFMRDSAFPARLVEVLGDLQGLTGIAPGKWRFRPYGHTDLFDATADILRKQVDLQAHDEDDDTADDELDDTPEDEDSMADLEEFFRPSMMDGLTVVNEQITLRRLGRTLTVTARAFNSVEQVFEQMRLTHAPLRLDESARRGANSLRYFLGETWSIDKFNNVFLLSHPEDPRVLAVLL